MQGARTILAFLGRSYPWSMGVTLNVPVELAAQVISEGKDSSCTALEALVPEGYRTVTRFLMQSTGGTSISDRLIGGLGLLSPDGSTCTMHLDKSEVLKGGENVVGSSISC
jgi:hypothetical protein